MKKITQLQEEIMIEEERITGVMVQYYIACKRELWLFARHISFNQENQDIQIGKLLHEEAYNYLKRDVDLGFVKFDVVEIKEDMAISEVKKSSRLIEPVKYQLLYYMYIARKLGNKKLRGIIRIPKERKKISVELTENEEKEIERILEEIKIIIKNNKIPKPKRTPYCKNCAYFYFCWI